MSVPSLSHRAPLIDPRFIIESLLFSTISTDAFKAVGRDKGTPVLMLVVRPLIPVDHRAAATFVSNVRTLWNGGVISCLEVGVDDSGKAFVVLPQIEGTPITAGRIEGSEAERRFLSAARLIARVHELGVVCGDLSGNSWIVTRTGDVQLVAPCGVPEIETQNIESWFPKNPIDDSWKEFVAPEVLKGERPTPSSDVYSIAALGKRMLAQYLNNEKGAYLTPLIESSLASDPLLRPTSAGVLLEQIQVARQEHNQQLSHPSTQSAKASSPTIAKNKGDQKISLHIGSAPQLAGRTATPAENTANAAKLRTPKAVSQVQSRPFVVFGLMIMIAASFLIGTKLAARHQKERRDIEGRQAQLEVVAGNSGLEQSVRVLSNPSAEIAEKQFEFEKLTNSDDPLAHELLVRTALSASTEDERLLAERAIVERARRLGMLRSAEQGRTWLRGLKETELPAEYESVLRLLNATLPEEARLGFLKQVLAHDADLATRLTAAEALDLQTSNLTDLLAQLVSERSKITDTNGKSLLALLVVDSQLSVLYGDDIVQRRDQFSQSDLGWVLPILADRNDPTIRPLANLALERSAVSPINSIFLELIRDRSDLTPAVLATLVRSATGKTTSEDIATLGRWIDTGAESALLALCATLPNGDERALDAFDTLAGRSSAMEPAYSMVQWIRQNRWAERAQYVEAVGAMSLASRMTLPELQASVQKFSTVLNQSALLEILVRETSPEVSGMLVDQFGDKLGMGGLINLLSHPDKRVRISAIHGLKDVNEAAILRLVLEKYQKEKDEDVKKEYKNNFWVVRERVH